MIRGPEWAHLPGGHEPVVAQAIDLLPVLLLASRYRAGTATTKRPRCVRAWPATVAAVLSLGCAGREPASDRVIGIGDIEEMFSRAHEATKGLSTLGPRWNEMVRSSAANSRAFGEALRGCSSGRAARPAAKLRGSSARERAGPRFARSGNPPRTRGRCGNASSSSRRKRSEPAWRRLMWRPPRTRRRRLEWATVEAGEVPDGWRGPSDRVEANPARRLELKLRLLARARRVRLRRSAVRLVQSCYAVANPRRGSLAMGHAGRETNVSAAPGSSLVNASDRACADPNSARMIFVTAAFSLLYLAGMPWTRIGELVGQATVTTAGGDVST